LLATIGDGVGVVLRPSDDGLADVVGDTDGVGVGE
jgi:hypothetical protein